MNNPLVFNSFQPFPVHFISDYDQQQAKFNSVPHFPFSNEYATATPHPAEFNCVPHFPFSKEDVTATPPPPTL